jgi:aminopeptidase N
MRNVLCVCAACICLAAPVRAQVADGCSFKNRLSSMGDVAYADPSIDVSYYALDLTISLLPPFLSGRVRVAANPLADQLRSITLDLSAPMTVDSVLMNGVPVPFQRGTAIVTITLDRAYARGEVVALDIRYHGTPVGTGFGSFTFSQLGSTPWVWTLSEPYGARDWWPCKDHPSDKADSVDIVVTCPGNLTVASNGRRASVVANGDGTSTTHWIERYPIATYLVFVAFTDYASFSLWFRYGEQDSMEIMNFVTPGHLGPAIAELARTPAMLRLFSDRYGLYPFIKEKYGHNEFGRGGAMEHQTMTSTSSFSENIIAHELAHQWFGDLITCASWRELWLNEGFARYSEAVYQEATYGTDAYRATIGASLSAARHATGPLRVQDTTNVSALFDQSRVYAKGAAVLHMLRHIVGDGVFFRILRAYVADPRFRFGNATTEGFRSVCENVTGTPLGWFFDEWVDGENYPRYSYSWKADAAEGRWLVTFTLSQTTGTSSPSFFVMPVDVRFSNGAHDNGTHDSTITVMNTSNPQQFLFSLDFPPSTVRLDPGEWILRDVLTERPPLPTAVELLPNYPNPFNAGTTIRLYVPHRTHILLRVITVLGQPCATLVDRDLIPGIYEFPWNGLGAGDRPTSSGVYFASLSADGATVVRPMMVLR